MTSYKPYEASTNLEEEEEEEEEEIRFFPFLSSLPLSRRGHASATNSLRDLPPLTIVVVTRSRRNLSF